MVPLQLLRQLQNRRSARTVLRGASASTPPMFVVDLPAATSPRARVVVQPAADSQVKAKTTRSSRSIQPEQLEPSKNENLHTLPPMPKLPDP